MGKVIEQIALERNHQIVCIVDKNINKGKLHEVDVAINFSTTSAAVATATRVHHSSSRPECFDIGDDEDLPELELEENSDYYYLIAPRIPPSRVQ